MGACVSNVRSACRSLTSSDDPPMLTNGSPADTSDMPLEQLFRMGIAEAQMATVLPKRHRLKRIHTARELLKIALQRCRSGDANLRTHLYAVLLKLGEDARSIQGLCEERKRQRPGLVGDTPGRHGFRGGSGDVPRESVNEEICTSSDSAPSAEGSDARLWEFNDIGKVENISDNEHVVEHATASMIASTTETVCDGVCLRGSDHNPNDAASGGGHDASDEQIVYDERGGNCIGGPTYDDLQRSLPLPALGDGRKRTSEPVSSAASAACVSPSCWGVSLEDAGAELSSWPVPVSPGAGVNSPGASWTDATAWPTAVGTASWPIAPLSGSSPRREASTCSSMDREGKETLSARARAVPPQQLSGAQVIVKRQRSGVASSGNGMEQIQGGDWKVSEMIGRPSQSPPEASRHTGKLPSHSSSSGSQGAVSDSDSSSVAQRKRHGPYAPAIKEEARGEDTPHRGEGVSAVGEGSASKTDLTFRPLRRTSPASDDDDKHEPSTLPQKTLRRHDDFSSNASVDEASAQNCRVAGRPSGHSRTSSGMSVADVFASQSSDPWQAPKTSLTPKTEKAATSATPALEKATAASEIGLCNPLTQPELLAEALPQRVSSMPSPYAQSHASADSFSLAGSCLPSASPSPFVSNAVVRHDPTITPSLGNAAAADVLSVRIVNGVSGEEEVRFLMSVQDSFSEQHLHSMIDARCKEKAGQALSDLNWLSKTKGDRYQRRKCDLRMVEDLFAPSGGPGHRPIVLLLCTVPVPPPSELPTNKVHLKTLTPCRVAYGQAQPVRLQLETSKLDEGHDYSMAFTHQWSNMTYSAEATVLPSQKGLEAAVPWQALTGSSDGSTDGLYDVHLIMDRSSRSKNRRTLNIVSAESEFSSSTAMSS
eukprot:TRINITY_DN4264_c0_g2_i1.p1 TRINITY_DN4264_c0_g2~~TRINITY_DN4264_c0_g2_i1.p1  ORF type:complete len:881 (-),score=120.72 TRINITY_DN4264_c0_g2_i1:121-2763(-)